MLLWKNVIIKPSDSTRQRPKLISQSNEAKVTSASGHYVYDTGLQITL